MLVSNVPGNLVFIYSTSRDRAQEVLRAVKQYIYYALSTKSQLVSGITVVRDTESILGLQGLDGRTRIAAARPKNIESCRGDAPHGVIVDEVRGTSRPRLAEIVPF